MPDKDVTQQNPDGDSKEIRERDAFKRRREEKNQRLRELAEQRLADLPNLDSPAFWTIVEQPFPTIAPEVIVEAISRYKQQGQIAQARRLFDILYDQFTPLVRRYAKHNQFLRGQYSDLLDNVVQETWMTVFKRLSSGDLKYYVISFRSALWYAVLDSTEAVLKRHGIIKQPGARQETGIEARFIVPVSLDAERRRDSDSEEYVSLGMFLEDAHGEQAYRMIELSDMLRSTLSEMDRKILSLWLNEQSNIEIGRTLQIDRETVARHKKQIEQQIRAFYSA